MSKMFFRHYGSEYTDYIILEKSKKYMEQARKDGYDAILEDASRFETLSKFNTSHCDITVLCLTASDVENIYITLNAKSISPSIRVIARANDTNMISKFEHAGADHILMPNRVANTMIHTAITQPTMYKAIHAILTGKSIARIDEIRAYEYEAIVGKTIKELFFKESKLLFMGIQRDNKFMFIPSSSEVICKHDILLVMGREISLNYFKSLHKGSY
jgi:voltage-gated potassium channel